MARNYTRQELLDYRKEIVPVRQKAQEEIDKQVLAMSSAALALSLTFYKDVLKDQIISFGWILQVAWVCWMLAITSVVFSMYLTTAAIRNTREKIDTALDESEKPDEVNFEFKGATGWQGAWLPWVNVSNLGIFLVGTLSFALVLLLNIHINPKTIGTNEPEKRSTPTLSQARSSPTATVTVTPR